MKKEINNVFQILFGKFLFWPFWPGVLFFKKEKQPHPSSCGKLVGLYWITICPSVAEWSISWYVIFLGGERKSLFFFPFWKWVDDCYLCVVLCAGARTLQGDVVCMLTSLAWRIVRRVNGQSSPAASQCTQSLLIIRQHLVSVSFLKFCFLLFKPRKLFLCQTPILILCFCFTTSSQKRLKNVDRNSCCRSCCWSRRKIAIRLTRRCFTSSSQIIPTRNNHVLYRSSSSSSTYVQEEMYIV